MNNLMQKLKDTAYKTVELKNMLYMSRYVLKEGEESFNMDKIRGVDMLYITVAFNNAVVLAYQLLAIKKFSDYENWGYLIVDNSTNIEEHCKIRQWCIDNEVAYIRLPKCSLKLSDSHACALNWVCRNVISGLKGADAVGFLDHDIFPIKSMNIKSILKKQDIYGYRREVEKGKWYIWPGLFFMNLSGIYNIENLNFRPCDGMDTGGGIYYQWLRNLDITNYHFADREYREVVLDNSNKAMMWFFDNRWYHIGAGSNWSGNPKVSERINAMYGWLEQILL